MTFWTVLVHRAQFIYWLKRSVFPGALGGVSWQTQKLFCDGSVAAPLGAANPWVVPPSLDTSHLTGHLPRLWRGLVPWDRRDRALGLLGRGLRHPPCMVARCLPGAPAQKPGGAVGRTAASSTCSSSLLLATRLLPVRATTKCAAINLFN